MAGISTGGGNVRVQNAHNANYTPALVVLTSLFFIWAVITNLNDILIPHLKKACDLSDAQSALVQTAFFLAYFIMSLPSGAILKRTGYKKGIVVGLGMMLLGALAFVPAAMTRNFGVFLAALFALGSGITLLQTAANPYVAVLGPPETSSARLNLTQAFNSLGASLGPLIGGWLILSAAEKTAADLLAMTPEQLDLYRSHEAQSVIMPYLGLAVVILGIMALIWFSNLPEIDNELEEEEPDYQATHTGQTKTSAWQYSHLVWGAVAIFFYVGAEVAIGSFLIKFAGMDSIAGLGERDASRYPSIYMFCAMLGRFAGAALLSRLNPNRILGINGLLAIVFLAGAITLTGEVALWAATLVGFFNSIMFPTIFTLGIKDLGKHTKQGSSILIMAIVGGAIVPPVMGLVSDALSSIQVAFIVPLVCYLSVVYFGFIGSRIKGIH